MEDFNGSLIVAYSMVVLNGTVTDGAWIYVDPWTLHGEDGWLCCLRLLIEFCVIQGSCSQV